MAPPTCRSRRSGPGGTTAAAFVARGQGLEQGEVDAPLLLIDGGDLDAHPIAQSELPAGARAHQRVALFDALVGVIIERGDGDTPLQV